MRRMQSPRHRPGQTSGQANQDRPSVTKEELLRAWEVHNARNGPSKVSPAVSRRLSASGVTDGNDPLGATADMNRHQMTPYQPAQQLKYPLSHPANQMEDFESVSVSNSYSGEWEKLFRKKDYHRILKQYGLHGRLRSTRFRSVCWKVYLEVLPASTSDWIEACALWRNKYQELKTKLVINPRQEMDKDDLSVNNPLSQESSSPWNRFFLDNELMQTIKQDVVRTYPDLEFFQSKKLQEIMVTLLFCYSKQYQNVNYKQGMHELLAPLIFVLHCDHQAFLHASEIESLQDVVKVVLNPDYIEHDAFALFCQIMGTVEPWYYSKEMSPTVKNNNILTAQPFAKKEDLNPSNAIITKLTWIQDYILNKYDPELHQYLLKMDILPQIYGIRWVRLLFGREFPMQDLLVIWDAIFADGLGFDLVDYIFVAMMIYIHEYLLTGDYASCLGILMRYPPVGDVNFFVQKALYLRDPHNQPKPREYMYPRAPQSSEAGQRQTLRQQKNSTPANIANKAAANVVSSLSTLTRRIGATNQSNRPRTLPMNQVQGRLAKSSSEPMNLMTDQSPEKCKQESRGSTASLSHLEDDCTLPDQYHKARSETASVGSPEDETRSLPGQLYSIPRTGAKFTLGKSKKTEKELQEDLAMVLGKMHDKDDICRRCAEKMEKHIAKLQREVMSQSLANEDEIMMSLAGLKQVRDVLKGVLTASNIFNSPEQVQEDGDSSITPASASSWTSSSGQERIQAKTTCSSGESTASSSPEYSQNVPPSEQADRNFSKRRSAMGHKEYELVDLPTPPTGQYRNTSLNGSDLRATRKLQMMSVNGKG